MPSPPLNSAPSVSPLRRALRAIELLEARLESQRNAATEPIAVVGVACRFPGEVDTPADLWKLLAEGRDAVTQVPPGRWNAEAFRTSDPHETGRTVSRHGGFLKDIECFDPVFFGISPREAARMDPQHRLVLEVAHEALTAAGQPPDRRAGRNTGVFLGITSAEYGALQLEHEGLHALDTYQITGNALNTAAGRLAFVFGLHGPCLATDTACSSSLTALHLACASLRAGECETALAAGVNALLSPLGHIALSRGQVLSPTGRARTFDAAADGMVRGEGCGAVVLKCLGNAQRDGDAILAVIRASAINQDGPSSGLTVPNGPAQEGLLRQALKRAGLTPDDIDYLEAHGTGTSLGDPIEMGAIGNVFAPDRPSGPPLRLGSIKTNFGHLESAAGIAGFIKCVLALHHEAIPPHLHFNTPSPHIDWREGRLQVPVTLTPWPRGARPRRAGLSSFGFSGTNVHVVLEEAPDSPTDPKRGIACPNLGYKRQRFPLPPPLAPEPTDRLELPGLELSLPGATARRFELRLTCEHPEWISDHQVYGHRVFPAAAWFELARRVGVAAERPTLGDARLDRALVIPPGQRVTLQSVLQPDGRIEIHARTDEHPEWQRYLSGHLSPDTASPPPPALTSDGSALDPSALYETYRQQGLDYGPAFQGLSSLRPAKDGTARATVQLPTASASAGSRRAPHPALLDACFQAVGAAFATASPDATGEVWLPVAVGRWNLLSPTADFHGPLNVEIRTRVDDATAHASFVLLDHQSRPVARLDDLELQRATAEALASQLAPSAPVDWLYHLVAVPAPVPALAINEESAPVVWRTPAFLDPHNPDLATVTASLLQQLQILGEQTTPPRLQVITPDPTHHPAAAALWGLGRVAQSEWPHVSVQLIGCDDPATFTPDHTDDENQILHRDGQRFALRLQALPVDRASAPPTFPANRPILITGGLGSLGRLAAAWLIDRGARRLVLVSRRAPSPAVAAELETLRRRGVELIVCNADLADAQAVADLVARFPDLAGVIHAAGTIEDAALGAQSPATFSAVATAKTRAARLLATALHDTRLDFWISFSSSAGVLGTPGQANYAAANAWLDAFAPPARRHLSVAWGPWSVGLGADLDDRYRARGIGQIDAVGGFALLDQLFATTHTAVAVLPIHWPTFFAQLGQTAVPRLLADLQPTPHHRPKPLVPATPSAFDGDVTALLRCELARVLRLSPDQLHDDRPLTAQGLDSLMAVELRHGIQRTTGLDLSAVLFLDDLPLSEIATKIAAKRKAPPPQAPARPSEPLALSHGQSALWFLHQTDPTSAAYHTAFALRLRGPLDVDRLRILFGRLRDRHPQLRARFPRRGGEPVIQIDDIAPLAFSHEVVGALPETELAQRIAADYGRPFDLERGPPFRVSLYQNSGDTGHVLLCTVHHIVSDAWTNWLLLDEFRQLYEGVADLPLLTATYADFVAWQNRYLSDPRGQDAWTHWQSTLSGPLPVLDLPADYPRPAVLQPRGASVPLQLPTDLFGRLQSLARAEGTTAFNLLLTAWQVWLHRHTHQTDILVGSPTSGRTAPEFRDVAGYFVNPVPFRARLDPSIAFTDLLAANRTTTLAALTHADFPLPLMVERLKLPRDPSRPALFQNLFVYQKPQQGVDAAQTVGDLAIEAFPLAQMEGQFELTLEIFEGGGGSLKYNTALFSSTTATRFAARFRRLLESIVAAPRTSLTELDLLPAEERALVLETWNTTTPDFSCEHTLPELLLLQLERTPQAPALTFADTTLTYAELFARAFALAARLQTAGVQPDTLIGVCAERSIELVVALLGITLAGGAYVPFDPSYPEDRLSFMHEDAGVAILLTTPDFAETWRARGATVELIDSPAAIPAAYDFPAGLTPDHAAYLIYTSGSTGRPKGALNVHRAIVNRLKWMQAEYPLTHDDAVLQKTPFSFDVSVWEFFWPLLNGARLVVARPGGHQDPRYLVDLIRREAVTTLHFVPSMLQLFVEAADIEQCPSLRRVMCSGEALPADLPARFFARHPSASLHNLYGPTEAAVDVTFWACERQARPGPIPIGRPVARTQLYILDANRQPVPVGVSGELHLGGVQLMRGYHQRPDLNAEKLIPNPFGSDRLYRTGDLARWRPDGAVEYLGRIDGQIKLRGFRIELGEIESALGSASGVREAAVLLRQDSPADPRLTAYIVPQETVPAPSFEDLRTHLRRTLPDHMVPTAWVQLATLPLTPNGKLDRRALPAPSRPLPLATVANALASPVATERRLANHWTELLGHNAFNRDDNFFDLGGHSLHLGRLHARLQNEGAADLELVELFQYPTLRTLAARLDRREAPSSSTLPTPPASPEPTRTDSLRDQRARRRAARSP